MDLSMWWGDSQMINRNEMCKDKLYSIFWKYGYAISDFLSSLKGTWIILLTWNEICYNMLFIIR